MFKRLNKYLFQKRAQKYLSSSLRERRFVSYAKAKTVLLLFESDFSEKNLSIRRMINQLQQDGKKVSAWGFVNKKEVASSILPDFRILHHKQTDIFQKPLISFINELDNMEFDLLIDLSLKPLIALEYLAMYANASCKAGAKKTELPILDFVIDLENIKTPENSESNEILIDETYLFEQIIFYLKRIQTND